MRPKPATVERSDSLGLGTRLTLFPNSEHICSGWSALENPLLSLSPSQGRVLGCAHLELIAVLASDPEMDFCSVFLGVLGLCELQVRWLVCAISELESEHNRFTARTKIRVPTTVLFTLLAVGSLEVFGGFARWEISAQFFLHCVDMGSEESRPAPEKRAPLGSRVWLHCNKNKHNDRPGPQRPENRRVTQRTVTQQ
ncbi:uncharacterized [Tachysurus ichikawai]